ncbi:MAG: ExsB family transcriptional regulator [Bacteroidetes bacterium]|nr:ExsB family transcriptional regulator [Bacteroidota bacterium]
MTTVTTKYNTLITDIVRKADNADRHLVAYSGGVDSALVAKAVYDAFPSTSEAVMALSPSVSEIMRSSAIALAEHIGIPLRFVETREHLDPVYVANEGMSCYVCKHGIYTAMEAIIADVAHNADTVLLYNGTNADDLTDPTRVGLQAAREHFVRSPLAHLRKEEVRALSRHAGLPNWNDAASPCLRSRLSPGVEATAIHLQRIETAEDIVRTTYVLSPDVNFRVRHLGDDSAMLEIDAALLDDIDLARCREALLALGFGAVEKRAFRSGSVSIDTP